MERPWDKTIIPKSKAFFDDEEYQDRLLRVLQSDPTALQECAPLLKAEDFKPVPHHRWGRERWIVAARILAFYYTQKRPIDKLLRANVLAYAKECQDSETQVQKIDDYLTHLRKIPLVPAEEVTKPIIEFKRQRLSADLLEKMVELQAAGKLTVAVWREMAEKATAHSPVIEPVSGATLYATDYPAPAFAVNNKLPTGLAMLAAKPKIGKTWMALQLATAIACGRELFLGGKVKTPGTALYCALEDGERRFSERLHMLAPDAEASNFEGLHILYSWPGVEALGAAIRKHSYKLIVIDPYLAITTERKTQDIVRADYSELQPLRRLAEEFKTTIVVVHHLRKASGEARDLIIGTTGLTAAVDTLWILENTPDGDRTKRLTITGRDVRERKLNLELLFTPKHHGWRLVAEGPAAEAGGPLQRRILELLAEAGPMTSRAITDAIQADPNSVMVTLSKMRAANRVEKREGKFAYPGKAR